MWAVQDICQQLSKFTKLESRFPELFLQDVQAVEGFLMEVRKASCNLDGQP